VADEHREITTGDLAVELRHREAVVAARAPAGNAEVVELVVGIGIEPAGVGGTRTKNLSLDCAVLVIRSAGMRPANCFASG